MKASDAIRKLIDTNHKPTGEYEILPGTLSVAELRSLAELIRSELKETTVKSRKAIRPKSNREIRRV